MPFIKGHKLSIGNSGGGRKGYEYEKGQLETMNELLSGFLELAVRIKEKRANRKDIEVYCNLEKTVLKIFDKLHASKQESKVDAEITGQIDTNIQKIIDKIYGS